MKPDPGTNNPTINAPFAHLPEEIRVVANENVWGEHPTVGRGERESDVIDKHSEPA